MMIKLAKDDRIEQLSAQRRRMKQTEHRRVVEERIIEETKQSFNNKRSPCVCTLTYSTIQILTIS